MLEIALEGTTRLDSLGRRLRVATEKKMIELTALLYDKVVENVSGKILQKQTGELAKSIQRSVDLTQDEMVGTVYVDPVTAKAEVLERGGKGYYVVLPTKANFLHFYWTKLGQEVWLKRVDHPPSREFAYMREALREVAGEIPRGFRNSIQAVIYGEDI